MKHFTFPLVLSVLMAGTPASYAREDVPTQAEYEQGLRAVQSQVRETRANKERREREQREQEKMARARLEIQTRIICGFTEQLFLEAGGQGVGSGQIREAMEPTLWSLIKPAEPSLTPGARSLVRDVKQDRFVRLGTGGLLEEAKLLFARPNYSPREVADRLNSAKSALLELKERLLDLSLETSSGQTLRQNAMGTINSIVGR
ncbi:MAG: hypothetical protein HY399_08895, partial [Elusimicrobia bacterium]|nr:hypothetical protein [Elusimicrobiota bacterium]